MIGLHQRATVDTIRFEEMLSEQAAVLGVEPDRLRRMALDCAAVALVSPLDWLRDLKYALEGR